MIAQWVEDYGEDSDFVRVRVRGEFPQASWNQLIAQELVAHARKYKAKGYETLPRIIAADVARFGNCQSVIGMRQGRKFRFLGAYRGLDTAQFGDRIIEFIESEQPDATIIDADGLGAGTVDHIRFRGYRDRMFEFHGGNPATNTREYFNKRAECWGLTRDWLKAGAEIPDDPELETDLTGPEYGFTPKNQIQLEKKEEMMLRGLSSPDKGDTLAMTFGETIRAKPRPKPAEPLQLGDGGPSDGGWMA